MVAGWKTIEETPRAYCTRSDRHLDKHNSTKDPYIPKNGVLWL